MAATHDSFMLRSDYGELAKAMNSAAATITTVCLFTRLWARSTQYKGLWLDDYLLIGAWLLQVLGNGFHLASPMYGFRMQDGTAHGWTLNSCGSSCLYLAIALVQSAFSAALIRLSTGRIKVLLYAIVATMWAFASTLAVISWLRICGKDQTAAFSACVSMTTVIWIHSGNTIFETVIHLILAYLPWILLRKVSLPQREKLAVGCLMSLVGLASGLSIARVVLGVRGAKYDDQGIDWTYGAVVITCLVQAPVPLYFIAQTIPLVRVILQKDERETRLAGSVNEITPRNRMAKQGKKPTATAIEPLSEARLSVELVVLPSGKVVRADSDEAQVANVQALQSEAGPSQPAVAASVEQQDPEQLGPDAQDPVHENWAKMGFSKRAWSPHGSTQQGTHSRHQSLNAPVSVAG